MKQPKATPVDVVKTAVKRVVRPKAVKAKAAEKPSDPARRAEESRF